MNELSKLLQENLNIEFISATLSNPKKKDDVQKVKIRPVLKKRGTLLPVVRPAKGV